MINMSLLLAKRVEWSVISHSFPPPCAIRDLSDGNDIVSCLSKYEWGRDSQSWAAVKADTTAAKNQVLSCLATIISKCCLDAWGGHFLLMTLLGLASFNLKDRWQFIVSELSQYRTVIHSSKLWILDMETSQPTSSLVKCRFSKGIRFIQDPINQRTVF